MTSRRKVLTLACLAAMAHAVPAAAQGFPDKPVKLIIPYAPGGPTNLVGRMFGQKLSQMWNQTVVVENLPGASGHIGAAAVAKAPPDGYTLLLMANAHVVSASLYDKLPYDPVRDLGPLSQILQYPLVLVVNPSVPANTLAELIALSKKTNLGLASAGTGSSTHLAAELFGTASGLAFAHVPYKGAGPATSDLVAGHAQMMFNDVVSAMPFVRSGRLRAIATTGLKRASVLPNVPTISESGFPGFEAGSWLAIVGPAGMPSDVVRKLSADINTVVQQEDTRARFAELGVEPLGTSAEQLGKIMQSDFEKWTRVIRAGNIKSE